MQQAISWWCFAPRLMTPKALVQTAVEIGYEAVELVPAEHWALAQAHGLAIATIAGHQSIAEGLNRRENHDRIEGEIRTNLEHAVKWGIPNLICFSGNRAGLDDETGAQITAEGLRRVAPLAEQARVNLIVELLNSKVNHADYQCDRTPWGVKVCDLVGSPRVKLLYDIYHMQIMEGDIIRTIRDYHPYFAHYHTAGNPGRNELDDTQELYYPAIIRAIHATGYSGYLGHEFVPVGDPRAALQAAFDLSRAACA
ncbi:MAG: TIM barrel protein [Caldilineaceae bacterium]